MSCTIVGFYTLYNVTYLSVGGMPSIVSGVRIQTAAWVAEMEINLIKLNESMLSLSQYPNQYWLTHKQLETHGCVLSIVATDAMVLKHQAISIHSAE